MYQGEETAFISSKTVRDINNFNTIISQQTDLKVLTGNGVEKWSASIESPLTYTKVVGMDTQGQWYDLTQRDSLGRVLTFSAAVSYTHLDVYKRQVFDQYLWLATICTQKSERGLLLSLKKFKKHSCFYE